MSNPLSDIYSKILLNETESNVVVPAGKLEIAKGGKEPLIKDGGDEKAKKNLNKPEEGKVEDGELEELKDSMNTPTTKSAFEGTFEKLFKATLTEDVAEDAASAVEPEVPTTPEDSHEEIEDTHDEVGDLASDLRDIIDKLEAILDKVGGVDHTEGEHDEDMETELGEAVSEPELKPLGDKTASLKSTKKFTTSNVKPHGGKASHGDISEEPELKPLADKSAALRSTKKFAANSSVKVGDFFK
jgi:hypothetical protein